MVEEQQKRQVARKLWIGDILAGKYVKEQGSKPNHIILKDNSIAARVNIIGVVVSASSEGLPIITLDDGSGRINVRAFEPNDTMSSLSVGDVVLVIGRPRQFAGEMYVLPEIVRRLSDLRWIEVRKLELTAIQDVAVPEAPQESISEETLDESFEGAVINAIRSLDAGNGAEIDAVIANVGFADAEKVIRLLLQKGDIFEVGPGRLKIIE
ncbi:MAG: OB-fold nucleic acid binding domain-containing protein [Candidatus Woesearchaeota archaeon]